ncbi:MAG: hypothetical protein WKG03_00760 [Telluria sp.]
MSMRTPLEAGFGGYMSRFYVQLVADTPAMAEYIKRGLSKSVVWAPGRMIDSVEEMLAEWRKNDNEGGPSDSSMLPVMICAMSKDFQPSMADWGVAVGTSVDVMSPDDPHERTYKLRTSSNEYRVQVAIIAPEGGTAHSLAMQFNLYANGDGGRRFTHRHMHGDIPHDFPAVLEQIDLGAIDSRAEQKNITILTVDMNLRAVIPIFKAPGDGEANDGKPAPAGYPVVLEVNAFDKVSLRASRNTVNAAGVIKTEWTA